jgi:hypothetical protein
MTKIIYLTVKKLSSSSSSAAAASSRSGKIA